MAFDPFMGGVGGGPWDPFWSPWGVSYDPYAVHQRSVRPRIEEGAAGAEGQEGEQTRRPFTVSSTIP